MEFSLLDQLGFGMHLLVYLTLCAIAVGQWVVVYSFVRARGLATRIPIEDLDEARPERASDCEVVPLARDMWFVLWNLLPIVLLTMYGYMWHRWENWSARLQDVFGAGGVGTWARWSGHPAPETAIVLIVMVSLVSCLVQLPKHHNLHKVYWWDRGISRGMFWVRFIALFANMSTLLLVATLLLQVAGFLTEISFFSEMQPRFFHADGAAGMTVVGELSVAVAMPCLIVSGFGIVALIDHQGQGVVHTLGDLALVIGGLAVAVWVAVGPPVITGRRVVEAHRELAEVALVALAEMEDGIVARGREPGTVAPGEAVDWFLQHADALGAAERATRRPDYPLDLVKYLFLLVPWLAPAASSYTFRKVVRWIRRGGEDYPREAAG